MVAKSTIPGVDVYFKPNTAQVVMRRHGVERVSERVKAQNMVFARAMTGKKIATACKQPAGMPPGKKYKAFKACLFVKGKEAFGKTV